MIREIFKDNLRNLYCCWNSWRSFFHENNYEKRANNQIAQGKYDREREIKLPTVHPYPGFMLKSGSQGEIGIWKRVGIKFSGFIYLFIYLSGNCNISNRRTRKHYWHLEGGNHNKDSPSQKRVVRTTMLLMLLWELQWEVAIASCWMDLAKWKWRLVRKKLEWVAVSQQHDIVTQP